MTLKAKGAVFVEELDEIPETDQPVIFSAHGVAKSVPAAAAKARNLFAIDATCPLVFKVHIEAARHHEQGLEILLIGHAGHPEVEGTMGQLPEGAVTLIETVADARAFTPSDPDKLAYATQTTLSVDDTAADRRRAQEPLPQHRRAAQRGHLLRHDKPAGGGQGDRPTHRLPARRRRPQQLELAAPRRGGGARGLPDGAPDPARQRHSVGQDRGHQTPSASRPAHRRPRRSSTRSLRR